jgi:hypothetical protein
MDTERILKEAEPDRHSEATVWVDEQSIRSLRRAEIAPCEFLRPIAGRMRQRLLVDGDADHHLVGRRRERTYARTRRGA